MYSFFRQLLKKDIFFILYLPLCCLIYQGVSGVGSDEVSEVSEKEGGSIRLESGVKTNQQHRIRWYFKNVRIAQITGDLHKICTDVQCNEGTERFRDRLELDHQTGSLTITNTRTTDSGLYLLEIISGSYSTSEKTYSVNVNATATDNCDNSDQNEKEFGEPCNDGSTKAFSEVFIPTLYSIVFILGFIGNGLVMWVLIRSHQKSNITYVCLFNLALSDLLFLVSLPFWAHSAMKEWVFGKFMCHIITGLFMLGLYSSILFMVLMTVDRYVVIVHARSTFSRNRSAKNYWFLALLVWILSLLASFPNFIFAKEKISSKTSCGSDFPEGLVWMSFICFNSLICIFPLIIMVFCYSRIISTLLRKKSPKRLAVIRLYLAVVTFYFIFWTPYNVVLFLTFLQSKGHLLSCEWHINLSLAMQWVETIALSHCCLNPIIYAFAGQKFKKAVLKVLSPSSFKQRTTLSQELSECTKFTEFSSEHIT